MPPAPSDVLAIFFAIDKETIVRDLREAEGNLRAVIARLESLQDFTPESQTAESEAQAAHWLMIQAYEMSRLPIAPELKVFYASQGAVNVTMLANQVARSKGQLADLALKLGDVQRKAGVPQEHIWFVGEWPDEAQPLNEEYDRLAEGIEDMMVLRTLRTYFLDEVADLFERDYDSYELQCEIGRRFAYLDENENTQLIDGSIQERHGADVLSQLKARVRELRSSRGL